MDNLSALVVVGAALILGITAVIVYHLSFV